MTCDPQGAIPTHLDRLVLGSPKIVHIFFNTTFRSGLIRPVIWGERRPLLVRTGPHMQIWAGLVAPLGVSRIAPGIHAQTRPADLGLQRKGQRVHPGSRCRAKPGRKWAFEVPWTSQAGQVLQSGPVSHTAARLLPLPLPLPLQSDAGCCGRMGRGPSTGAARGSAILWSLLVKCRWPGPMSALLRGSGWE